ncbi:MAG TPA: acetyl-CoA carboxylase biotin carboxyl carrier protein subunit [Pyrinomonadaceae bacterium]|jgi:biotin carboxyl carrier protein
MKLKALLNEQECQIALESAHEEVVADIDGRRYQLQAKQSPDGSYLILESGRVFECRVTPQHGSRDTFDVAISGRNYTVTIIDPRKLRADRDADHHHHGSAEITAPMPGKVVRVLVEIGQQVEAGAGLVVVEAMKMQNEMKSPRDGVVVSVDVTAGDTVEAGALLVVIE